MRCRPTSSFVRSCTRGCSWRARRWRLFDSVMYWRVTCHLHYSLRFLLSLAEGEVPHVSVDDFPFLYDSLRSEGREGSQMTRTSSGRHSYDSRCIGRPARRRSVVYSCRYWPRSISATGFPHRPSRPTKSNSERTEALFVLGPDVSIECGAIRPLASTYRVITSRVRTLGGRRDSSGRGNGDADSHGGRVCDRRRPIRSVMARNDYSWIDHAATLAPSADEDLAAEFNDLRRVLRFFRSHGSGVLGRHRGRHSRTRRWRMVTLGPRSADT